MYAAPARLATGQNAAGPAAVVGIQDRFDLREVAALRDLHPSVGGEHREVHDLAVVVATRRPALASSVALGSE